MVFFLDFFRFNLELLGLGDQTLKILGTVFKIPFKLVDSTLELISFDFMLGGLPVLGCSFLFYFFNRSIQLRQLGSVLEIRIPQGLE